jgi:hypothetical protein
MKNKSIALMRQFAVQGLWYISSNQSPDVSKLTWQ